MTALSLFSFLILSPSILSAQPAKGQGGEKQRGFFDEGFVTKGYFPELEEREQRRKAGAQSGAERAPEGSTAERVVPEPPRAGLEGSSRSPELPPQPQGTTSEAPPSTQLLPPLLPEPSPEKPQNNRLTPPLSVPSSPFFDRPAAPDEEGDDATDEVEEYSTYRSPSFPVARSNATLSLIVNAENTTHLYSVLRTLRHFREQYPVPLGEVLLIGDTEETKFFDVVRPWVFGPSWKGEYKKTLEEKDLPPEDIPVQMGAVSRLFNQTVRTIMELGVSKFNFSRADPVLDRLKVTTSPTWVIRVDGVDHVFEGNYDLSELFDEKGNFIGASPAEGI